MIEEMADYSDVDAEELWQLINIYAQGGHLLEVGNYVLSEDGRKEFTDYSFWPMDKEGQHVSGWWPEKREVDVLLQERLLEPQKWEDSPYSHTENRKYKLTAIGERLASSTEEQVLAYFRERDESKDSDVEAAWAAEIERRIAEVESGEAETVSWEEARTRIRASLSKS